MKKSFNKILATVLTVIMIMTVIPFTGIYSESFFSVKANAIDLSSYRVDDIIEFGSYPQSKVTDSATVSALNSISKSWISYGYYSGTGEFDDGKMQPSDYMKYCDISYNGNKYRAVTFSSYRPYCTGYVSSASSYTPSPFGYNPGDNDNNEFQDDNGYYTENVYYFKYEPLTWRVLDPSEGFVMCEKAIDTQAYNNYVLYANSEYWGNSSQAHYASDWANSSIRAWLNNDFYNTAFTSAEKSQIGTTYNENKSAYSSEYDSADTSDKIFLLSYNEVSNSKYGFSSSYSTSDPARQIKSTDYAQCQGCCMNTSYYGNSWWWLRSPYSSISTAEVNFDGSANFYYYSVDNSNLGIVPALKFNPQNKLFRFSISVNDIEVRYKSTAKIVPQIDIDDGTDHTITYESLNPSVATVDKDGNITTLHKGAATIVCTLTDGFGNTVEDTCTVTVKFQWWQWIIWILLLGFLWY